MQRYDLIHDHIGDCYCDMKQSPDGDYVLFSDAQAALAELTEENTILHMSNDVHASKAQRLEAELVEKEREIALVNARYDSLDRVVGEGVQTMIITLNNGRLKRPASRE